MEVYIDDMLVKSVRRSDHLRHLSEAFDLLRKYQVKLNPEECTFGAVSGKFLGYLVTQWGYRGQPRSDICDPKHEVADVVKEVHILNGRLVALNMFFNQSMDKCKSFFQALMKNRADFYWDEECEAAFQGLKRYLTSPQLLSKPFTGETLFLYLIVSEFTVSGALVREDEGIQKLVYYISMSLTEAQTRYQRMKKLAFALFVTSRKLRHYF